MSYAAVASAITVGTFNFPSSHSMQISHVFPQLQNRCSFDSNTGHAMGTDREIRKQGQDTLVVQHNDGKSIGTQLPKIK
jgi:hypothetical protein